MTRCAVFYSSWFVLLALLCITAHAGNKNIANAFGIVSCRMTDGSIQPLKRVVVKLLFHDRILYNKIDETRSSTDGSFYIAESVKNVVGEPDPIVIQIVYEYQGKYGQMEVNGLAGITRKYTTKRKKYKQNLNFGGIVIADDHCRAYVQFYAAMEDYYARTGMTVPYKTLDVRTQVLIHGGTPYAIRSRVNIPKGYFVSVATAIHELGHTVRHTLDGNLVHFLYDVVRFNYLRHHTCSTKSNLGYAFNEGWAEFWANSCNNFFYGTSTTDYTIEGNVAIALRSIKKSCGLNDGQMINVLRKNPKKIHSFQDFKKFSGCS